MNYFLQQEVMMTKYNGQSETGKIGSILMKKAETAWKSQDNINKQWQQLHYPSQPDYEKVLKEYARFAAIIEANVPEVHYLPDDPGTGLDSIYTHDPVIITKGGAILCTMGKPDRLGEAAAIGRYLESIGMPILGEIKAPGKIEGGDIVWFDDDTVAVGLGYRTNSEGAAQLRALTRGLVKEVIEVPLPHGNGPDECLHLMSMISPIDRDLAVIYSPLMVVPFRDLLIQKGLKFVEVPNEEYDSFGCNVLALEPRKCVMIAGNPKTKAGLEKAGATVFEYQGEDVSIKGGGGPTCLTRPLFRS
jgi:arginine deiminase